jgi:hypothetical protein
MRKTFPVIWSLHGNTNAGKLEVTKERIELSSRGYTFAFPRDSVFHFVVDRGAESRIRGLAAITISLAGGEVVRIASLGGAGSLHDVAALLAPTGEKNRVRRQGLAGAGT